jgi:hypothetical protein
MTPVISIERNRPWDRWVLSAMTFAVPLVLFIVASNFYASSDFVDRQMRVLRVEDTWWLVALFGLPLLAQFLSMLPMILKGHRDRAVNRFYGLCMIAMSFSSSGYCLLWLLYTRGNERRFWSYVALVLIVSLVLLVGFVTYLIMRSPQQVLHVSPQLREDDIRENKGSLCSKLFIAKSTNSPPHLVKIFDVLGSAGVIKVDDVKSNVAAAVTDNQFDQVNLSAIVKNLNEGIIENNDFFQATDVEAIEPGDVKRRWYALRDGKLRLPASEKKNESSRVNRLLLEAAFKPAVIVPYRQLISNHSAWDALLADIKDGLTKSPFAALIFFFTVFLGVSYLFGFAFAFEDRAHLKMEGQPSLFMSRTHASNAADLSFIRTNTSFESTQQNVANENPSWPEYSIYFDAGQSSLTPVPKDFDAKAYDALLFAKGELENEREALENRARDYEGQLFRAIGWVPRKLPKGIHDKNVLEAHRNCMATYKSLKDNENQIKALSDSLLEKSQAWKKSKNFERIARVAKATEDEALYGRGILLELKGSFENTADQISAGRAKTPVVGFLKTGVALENEAKQNIRYLILATLSESRRIPRNIDWLYLPSAKDLSPSTAPEHVGETLEEILNAQPPPLLKDQSVFIQEKNRISRLQNKLEPADRQTLRDMFAQTEQIAIRGESTQEQTGVADKLAHRLLALQETRQSIEAKGINKGEKGNEVTVSILPIRDTHQFIPLSLMDYMYFTVYTITTTGYGDIIPITTYAKFLCSLANILEVFFLVVFFNALLSAKRRKV